MLLRNLATPLLFMLVASIPLSAHSVRPTETPEEARAIAKDAYIYGCPLVDSYLINSPMLPDMDKDADGGLTLYIQNESPGEDKESNWLPAPQGPFAMYMRSYWPAEAAIDGSWKQPPLEKTN